MKTKPLAHDDWQQASDCFARNDALNVTAPLKPKPTYPPLSQVLLVIALVWLIAGLITWTIAIL